MLNFALFAEWDSTRQKGIFSTRGINRSHLCRGRAYTPSIPHMLNDATRALLAELKEHLTT